MKIETVALESLSFDSENARTHPPENQKAIRRSLETFGQRKPIVVTQDNVVVAGNGTMLAAMDLGWKKIDIVRVPAEWGENEIRAFAIADNRTTDMSFFDPKVLEAQLATLEVAEFDLTAVGFDPAELKRLGHINEATSEFDPMSEWSGMPEYGSDDKTSHFHCIVHFADEDDVKNFFDLIGHDRAKTFWWPESDGLVGQPGDVQWVVDDEA